METNVLKLFKRCDRGFLYPLCALLGSAHILRITQVRKFPHRGTREASFLVLAFAVILHYNAGPLDFNLLWTMLLCVGRACSTRERCSALLTKLATTQNIFSKAPFFPSPPHFPSNGTRASEPPVWHSPGTFVYTSECDCRLVMSYYLLN